VLNPENRRLIGARGWVVYLETSVAQQAERAGRTRHRPLLHGADPHERLEQLMQVREPLYHEIADFVISTTRRRVSLVAESILAAFRSEPLPTDLA
jgi:shikimate kinase